MTGQCHRYMPYDRRPTQRSGLGDNSRPSGPASGRATDATTTAASSPATTKPPRYIHPLVSATRTHAKPSTISAAVPNPHSRRPPPGRRATHSASADPMSSTKALIVLRSEEHTSELQSHHDL